MRIVWGIVSACPITRQLMEEAFAAQLPEDLLYLCTNEFEAEAHSQVQVWIFDEVLLNFWQGPFVVLQGKEDARKGIVVQKPLSWHAFMAKLQLIREQLQSTYVVGEYTFDPKRRVLENRHRRVALREKEAELLLFLLQSPGQKADKQTLLKQVWGYHPQAASHTLETHIYQLRQKLEADPSAPTVLINEGAMYSLDHAVEAFR